MQSLCIRPAPPVLAFARASLTGFCPPRSAPAFSQAVRGSSMTANASADVQVAAKCALSGVGGRSVGGICVRRNQQPAFLLPRASRRAWLSSTDPYVHPCYTRAARLYQTATLCVRCRWSVDGAEDGAARTRRGRSLVGVFVNRCGTLSDEQHAVAKTDAEKLQPCGPAPGTQLCWCMPIAEP